MRRVSRPSTTAWTGSRNRSAKLQEQLRQTDETVRQNQDQLRLTDEIVRQNQDQLRLTDEIVRQNQDQLRLTNEAVHQNQDQLRLTNEAVHQNQDQTRQTNGTVRHTQVMMEDLRSDLQLVAEGVVAANEKLDRQEQERQLERREDRAFLRSVFGELQRTQDSHGMRLTRLEAART